MWPPSSVTSTGFLSCPARIWFKRMMLAFKAVNGTAPVCLQTLVRPHGPARALRSTTSALPPTSWYPHCWEQTKPVQWSCDSSLFWHPSGGTSSQTMSGQQSHSPSSTKDSRLIFSPRPCTAWLPLSCDKCIYCKLLWTKSSAKYPKCNVMEQKLCESYTVFSKYVTHSM